MAREDLRAIVDYIGNDTPMWSRRFGQELRDKQRLLAQHPELGRKGRLGLPDWLSELLIMLCRIRANRKRMAQS